MRPSVALKGLNTNSSRESIQRILPLPSLAPWWCCTFSTSGSDTLCFIQELADVSSYILTAPFFFFFLNNVSQTRMSSPEQLSRLCWSPCPQAPAPMEQVRTSSCTLSLVPVIASGARWDTRSQLKGQMGHRTSCMSWTLENFLRKHMSSHLLALDKPCAACLWQIFDL